ncbi:hypothetical protein DMENIID0001_086880 [Sergentomyia squamirostris]
MMKIVVFLAFCSTLTFAEISCDFDKVHGFESQPASTIPYELSKSTSEYSAGSSVTLQIRGNDQYPFRGFYVRAFDVNTKSPIGAWNNLEGSKTMDPCNAVMQSDRDDKQFVKLEWKAPAESSGKVYFKALIMQDYSTYWSNVLVY